MNDSIQPYSILYASEFVSSFHLEAQCKKKYFCSVFFSPTLEMLAAH